MYCKHCYTESPNTASRCIQCGEAFFEENETSFSKQKNTKKKFSLGIKEMVALAIGWYSGIFVLFLAGGTVLFWWFGKILLKPEAQAYRKAIAMQAGQLFVTSAFMIFAGVTKKIYFASNDVVGGAILDVLIPVIGISWLARRPNLKSIIFLSGYQVFAIIINIVNLSEMLIWTMNHKALVAHILWRTIALFLMWEGLMGSKSTEDKTSR